MSAVRAPILLGPSQGRAYDMGHMRAIFKGDAVESAGAWSISEWELEPGCPGPGAHSHLEDDIFFVLEGTVSLMLGDQWSEAGPGSFACAPGGTVHDFANRSQAPARFLNITTPGGFEAAMPSIVAWFRDNADADQTS